MYKLKIILMMLGRGSVYGAGLGALSGCAFGLPLIIFGGAVGILIGLGIGFGVGVVTGFVAGIITTSFFYPLKNPQRYRLSITLMCVVLSAILVPFAVDWFWFGHFSLNLHPGWFIFAFVAMITGLAFSKWLTAWYVHEFEFNTPIQPISQ